MLRMSSSDVFSVDECLPCGLTRTQIDQLFQASTTKDLQSCWVLAVMVFVKTGNIYEAVVAFLECLISSVNLSRNQVRKVEGAIVLVQAVEAAGNEELVTCVFSLILDLLGGATINKALWNFILCLFSGSSPPPSPPDPGDIDPPEYRECPRC